MASLGALVAAGRTSDVYEFGVGAVVKVPRPQVPDHWASLEADYTAAVRTLDVPAPSVTDLVETSIARGDRVSVAFDGPTHVFNADGERLGLKPVRLG